MIVNFVYLNSVESLINEHLNFKFVSTSEKNYNYKSLLN